VTIGGISTEPRRPTTTTDCGIPAASEASDFEMARATREVVSMLAGKWSVEVLYLLAKGTRRYSEVLYDVGEASKKTLTQTLRALEGHGLVARCAYPEPPRRVEYSLTPLGWTLTGPLMALYEWSAENLDAPARASGLRLVEHQAA
jgi:DNA-binding HxlR family transcriptional regulator